MDSSIVAQTAASLLTSEQVMIRAEPQRRITLLNNKGINDATHPVWVDGKEIKTYSVWRGMLERCYSARYQKLKPTYIGCSASAEWLRFSTFEKWMLTQDYSDKQLDKDILFSGNKVYSASTCVFASRKLNQLLITRRSSRGSDLPLGVTYLRENRKYMAQLSLDGANTYLGSYSTALEAHCVWQLAKAAAIEAFLVDDIRIRLALDRRVMQLREDAKYGRVTEFI